LVRRYFDRRLSEEAARARRYSTSFSVMLLDFDNFKEINDSYGHAVGDEVLRRVAEIILTEVRTIDVPARYGGDEYAIILPEVNWRGAMVLANRIMYRVRRERVRAGDSHFSFSLSIGLASYPEHAADDAVQILSASDTALYRAKSLGKSQIVVCGEEPQPEESAHTDGQTEDP
jgi:diguanylate cyclase (GGDEF)-like protein